MELLTITDCAGAADSDEPAVDGALEDETGPPVAAFHGKKVSGGVAGCHTPHLRLRAACSRDGGRGAKEAAGLPLCSSQESDERLGQGAWGH